ncbi:hypothetical protein BD626DRAFT_495649 [Schizophyllum amplum]|uniref:Uncharacterized protein n=1 Tax=Schizophyllum amplum TaxID=97359 RepID=A0A550CEB9_9AGAR|nr:hypothetical protein BD626DRAFT_495649 [Auriculariopsis ampla]
MFSSLSQFLPASLQQQNEEQRASQNAKTVEDDEKEDDEEDEERPTDGDENANLKKKDRKASETFIFVRPPPSKSNHPLNLQVQLVPPHTRTPGLPPSTPRQSIDSASTTGEPLSRTSSATSASTDYSASTASFTSISSTSSTRRAIVPLYNLQAHNVMTNTIVDAGTDAKIGKFQRKGLELIDLAILEPVEPFLRALDGAAGRLLIPAGERPTTPTATHTPRSDISHASSNTSLTSSGHRPVSPASGALPQRRNSTKKNIFGKFFSKKNAPAPTAAPVVAETVDPDATISTTPTTSRFTRHLKTLSITSTNTAGPPAAQFSPLPPDPSVAEPETALLPEPPVVQATLGLTPSLLLPRPAASSSSTQVNVQNAKKGSRPILGILGGLRGLGAGLGDFGSQQPGVAVDPTQNPMYIGGDVDMRIEWRRDKKRAAKRRAGRRQTARRRRSTASAMTGSTNFSGDAHRSTESVPASVRQQRRRRRGGREGRRATRRQRDAVGAGGGKKDGKERLKVRLATLSPTPHHPKVVAMLKVTWPLKAIDLLELAEVDVNDTPRPRTPAHLVITPEELKDIISCTGMWVVIREGFGGVGRERRRGDGWKIRG